MTRLVDDMKDERVLALLEVANDENEYSGWVALAQGALDVIEERLAVNVGLLADNAKLRKQVGVA